MIRLSAFMNFNDGIAVTEISTRLTAAFARGLGTGAGGHQQEDQGNPLHGQNPMGGLGIPVCGP